VRRSKRGRGILDVARVHESDSFDAREPLRLRRGVPRLLIALAFAGVIWLHGAAASATEAVDPPTPEDGYFQEVRTIAPGVWLLMEPRFQVQPIANVTVVEQADGLVLVNAGGSPGAGRRIVAMVRALSGKPVKAVVVTDWHGDRPQGLSEILKAWPAARTIATRVTQAHLRDPHTMNSPATPDAAANEAYQKKIAGFLAYCRKMGEQATDPRDRAAWAAAVRLFDQYGRDMDGALTLSTAEGFESRLSLRDSHTPVEARFLGRANTDGDAVVWLPRQRILVTGDMVVAPFPYGFESYPADWITTLGKLRKYPFLVLIPGHGAPQRDRAYVDRLIAALQEVRTQVGDLVARGATFEEVKRRVDVSRTVQGFVGDDPWLRRWMAAYWTDPIVTSAYKEAKGEPIVQDLNAR
jgi:glyoxylase-like metal-dependent hydrolase (beta-lactamase superfamily II)